MYETGPTQLARLVGMMTQCESALSSPLAAGAGDPVVVDRVGDRVRDEPEDDEARRAPRRACASGRTRRCQDDHDDDVEEDARIARIAQQLEQRR